MFRRLPQLLFAMLVIASLGSVASAQQVLVGDLSYDTIGTGQTEFDITNLTGLNSFAPFGPNMTTPLTFSITSLVVNFTTGPSLTFTASDFTVEDAQDDVDCDLTVVATCNLFGDSITSAVLTGTFSPTTGLSDPTDGITEIEPGFTTTITPSSGSTLQDGVDTAEIYATGVSTVSSLPEPGAWPLIFALTGLVLTWRAALLFWRRVQTGRPTASTIL